MLRTNSKKFKENLKSYVLNNINDEEFKNENLLPTCENLYKKFLAEKFCDFEYRQYHGNSVAMLQYWLEGLPSWYYFECSWSEAALDLGKMLEETPEEIKKYTEKDDGEKAYNLLARFICQYIYDHRKGE